MGLISASFLFSFFYLKDNKHTSPYLTRKYARIFALGHYLFLEAHSFARATLSENCSAHGTDNVCGQISEHIFAPNGGYCLHIFQKLFRPFVNKTGMSLVEQFKQWISYVLAKKEIILSYKERSALAAPLAILF